MDVPESSTQSLKAKRRRNQILMWLVIVIVLVIGLSYTGLISIPGVSSLLGTNRPRDLGIRTSPDNLLDLKAKIPMEIVGAPTSYSIGADQVFTGTLAVNAEVTSEEITAWLKRFEGSDPLFSDVQVKFIPGGMELSGLVHKYTTAPAYALVKVSRRTDASIDLSIEQAKVGIFNVPTTYRKQAETFFEDRINNIMASIDGFQMKTWELHDGFEVFKGTLPKQVRRSPRGWSGLLDL